MTSCGETPATFVSTGVAALQFALKDHFCRSGIYNEDCEIFAGA
jgi:hypothetical protein